MSNTKEEFVPCPSFMPPGGCEKLIIEGPACFITCPVINGEPCTMSNDPVTLRRPEEANPRLFVTDKGFPSVPKRRVN